MCVSLLFLKMWKNYFEEAKKTILFRQVLKKIQILQFILNSWFF